jgi:regulator of replication initiation timing
MIKNIGEYEVEAIHLRREIRRQNDKIERLRREGNGSMWEQENRGLRLENEQLREKYKKEREHSTDLGNKIDELLTRIEEFIDAHRGVGEG